MDAKDGGFKSRKMIISYVSILMIFLGFVLTAKYQALTVSFGEYCMGILAAASIYAGSNAATKWIFAKSQSSKKKDSEDEPKS
jgi:hypothetical protein